MINRPAVDIEVEVVLSKHMEAYLQKNFYKTGSLMANACRAAAMLENEDRTTCDAAFEYGRHLGLALVYHVEQSEHVLQNLRYDLIGSSL